MKESKRLGSAIKAIDDNGLRVGGYLVRFTSQNDTDLYGEYFDKDTDFWIERGYQIKGERALLEHGLENFAKVMPIGLIDMVTEDEFGIYVEAKLHDRKEYERMLRDMRNRKAIALDDSEIAQKAELAERAIRAIVETGKVQWSSGALPQGVEVDSETGHIKSWPIIEGSLTFTPAESDGTQIAPIKSALEQLSDFLKSIPAEPAREVTLPIEQYADNENNVVKNPRKSQKQGKNAMEILQKIVAMIQEYLAASGGGEESEAMASAVVEEVKAEMPEDEVKAMDEEEMVKAIAEKAYKLADAKLAQKQKALNSLDAMRAERMKAVERNAQPIDPFSSGGSRQGNPAKVSRVQITENSAYRNWSAEDYSFAVALEQSTRGTNKHFQFRPDNRFYHEMADKALKQYREGSLILSNDAIKSINAIKANELDHSTQTSYGDEWVPTLWADNIWEKPRLDNVVAPLFDNVEMPSNPYEYPIETTDPSLYFVPETTAETELALDNSSAVIPDSKVGTGKVTFTAKKLALRVGISAELEEDGIARLIPKFRQQAERTVQDGIDNLLLNGDTATTGNINSDGETITATTRIYQAQNALIKQALVTASTNALSASGNAPTLGNLRSIRGLLGNAYRRPQDLAYICDPSTYLKLLSIDAVVTVDKYGSQATILNGELGRIDGIPVFQTNEMALADTDGKVTQTSNVTDTGRLLLVHRPSWYLGFRRRISQSMTFLPFYDAWQMVMTVRLAFVGRTQGASDDSVSILYNIGV